MAERRTPVRDTLLVVFMPAVALLMVGIAAFEARTATHGWVALVVALAVGVIPPAVARVVIAHEGRLFLRDQEALDRNRARISRFSIPAGWLLGAALVAGIGIGGLALVIGVAVGAGALLGFWPGLLANYLRLKGEEWTA